MGSGVTLTWDRVPFLSSELGDIGQVTFFCFSFFNRKIRVVVATFLGFVNNKCQKMTKFPNRMFGTQFGQ